MKLRDALFITGTLLVLALLYLLSVTGRKPPDLPPDRAHVSARTVDECKACHDAGKQSPLRKEHPPKDQCLECHRFKEGRHGVTR